MRRHTGAVRFLHPYSALTLGIAVAGAFALIALRRSSEATCMCSRQESGEGTHGIARTSESDGVSIEIAALTPIYTADRADNSAGEVFAILGVGAAYVTATLAFSSQIFRSIGWLGPFLPLPLWIMVAYQSLLTGVAMVRSLSIRAIEGKLLESTDFSEQQSQAIGLQSSERVINVSDASFIHKAISFATYGGIVLMICAYTLFVILMDPHLTNIWRIIAYASYTIFAALVIVSHRDNFKLYNRSAQQLSQQWRT